MNISRRTFLKVLPIFTAVTVLTLPVSCSSVATNTDDIKPVETKEISVTSEDKISLLYDFLEELLFMHEVEFMLFSQFEVAIKKDGENYKLDAAIKGEEINWEIHERGEEVKAITFHMMDIVKEDNLYKSSVILDL